MRTKAAAFFAALALPLVAVHAQSNPCAQSCFIVYDWGSGGNPPDIDRMFGSPAAMEVSFAKALTDAGWRIVSGTGNSAMVITLRPVVQNRVSCDTMAGTNTDLSCHTVGRAIASFVSNDSSMKAPNRVEVVARCSDPKNYPTFQQFGQYAGEMIVFQMAGGKGARPTVKCRI